jgi:hypothetical protein
VNANEWNPSETLFEFVKWLDDLNNFSGAVEIHGPEDLFQYIHEFGIAKGLSGVSEEWKRGQDIAA